MALCMLGKAFFVVCVRFLLIPEGVRQIGSKSGQALCHCMIWIQTVCKDTRRHSDTHAKCCCLNGKSVFSNNGPRRDESCLRCF